MVSILVTACTPGWLEITSAGGNTASLVLIHTPGALGGLRLSATNASFFTHSPAGAVVCSALAISARLQPLPERFRISDVKVPEREDLGKVARPDGPTLRLPTVGIAAVLDVT